jgi:hypothetical protein
MKTAGYQNRTDGMIYSLFSTNNAPETSEARMESRRTEEAKRNPAGEDERLDFRNGGQQKHGMDEGKSCLPPLFIDATTKAWLALDSRSATRGVGMAAHACKLSNNRPRKRIETPAGQQGCKCVA